MTQTPPHVDAQAALDVDAAGLHRPAYIQALADEYRLLAAFVDGLETSRPPVEAAAIAGAVVMLCDNRIRQSASYLLPTLPTLPSRDVDLARPVDRE